VAALNGPCQIQSTQIVAANYQLAHEKALLLSPRIAKFIGTRVARRSGTHGSLTQGNFHEIVHAIRLSSAIKSRLPVGDFGSN
jgi:hypothetical protein